MAQGRVVVAMISTVGNAITKIIDEGKCLGVAVKTLSVLTSDNRPSRESRNWLDGNLDPH